MLGAKSDNVLLHDNTLAVHCMHAPYLPVWDLPQLYISMSQGNFLAPFMHPADSSHMSKLVQDLIITHYRFSMISVNTVLLSNKFIFY